MHYFFNDSINKESVNNLIERLEGQEDIKLYFGTDGGSIDPMRCLVSFFNSLGDNIEIVLTDELLSAGTLLLTDYTGKLSYDGLDVILFHKWDRLTYTLRKSHLISEDFLVKQTNKENKKFAKKLEKLGLSKKQIKRYIDGKDVILFKSDFKTLKQLQPYQYTTLTK